MCVHIWIKDNKMIIEMYMLQNQLLALVGWYLCCVVICVILALIYDRSSPISSPNFSLFYSSLSSCHLMSIWCLFCVTTFVLICWWGMPTQPPFHELISPFIDPFGLNGELIRAMIWRFVLLRCAFPINGQLLLNSRTIIVTWLKPSNDGTGVTLSSSLMAVIYIGLTVVFVHKGLYLNSKLHGENRSHQSIR